MSITERFLSHVSPEPNSGCWLWTAAHWKNGYGRFAKTTDQSVPAHRMAYQLFCAEIPKGQCVCHKCDNKSCVNPDHLFIGSHQENANDKVLKNRQAKGSKIRILALTKNEAAEIMKSKDSIRKLADKYTVSYGVVWGIKNGKSYKWAKE
jgi:hypothetical protein